MVFFYISKHVTKWIGPSLFRSGLRLRNQLTGTHTPSVGVTSTNNYWADMACMIPYSQKLLSLAVYDESKRRALEMQKDYQKEKKLSKGEQDLVTASSSSPSLSDEAMSTIAMVADPAATMRLSDMRVRVLEENLRSALIPNELWSDIERNWRYNLRIVAWARKEFLISKYGPYIQEAMVAYPQLRNSPQLSEFTRVGGGNKRQVLLDLVHRGQINTDNFTPTSKNKDSFSPFLQLPCSNVIVNAFRMNKWSNEKRTESIGQSLVQIAKNIGASDAHSKKSSSQGINVATKHIEVPFETDLSSTSLEDVLEIVTKGYVKKCGPLNALCQEANFYQLYSREYIQKLGDYLLQRTAKRLSDGDIRQKHGNRQDNDNTNRILKEMPSVSPESVIIDIGAGDGVLLQCLRDYMERKVMGLSLVDGRKEKKKRRNRHHPAIVPTMVATDDMSWRIFAKAEVEKLSVEQALEKYTTRMLTTTTPNGNEPRSSDETVRLDVRNKRPQVIVLCSWMPMGEDWTSHFRNAGVDEYILIGEADDGSCGDNWLTWGNPAFFDHALINYNDDHDKVEQMGSGLNASSPTPPYVEEGYSRFDMDPLTKYQFSSFDLASSKSSKTVSFRRRKRK